MAGEGRESAGRTLVGGEPEQPERERVDLVLGGPAIDAVFGQTLPDEAIYKCGETGCVEVMPVLAVVLEEHGEAGPECGDEVVGAYVAAADGPEGVVVGAELPAEAGCDEVADAAGRSGAVETPAEHAGVEVAGGCGVEVLRGAEEGEDGGGIGIGAVEEVEEDLLDELEGETVYGGGHGRGVVWGRGEV